MKNSDGSVDVVDRNGVMVNHIDRPWAVDAAGRGVPTWYEVDEQGRLVQVIDPQRSTVLPVLADPDEKRAGGKSSRKKGNPARRPIKDIRPARPGEEVPVVRTSGKSGKGSKGKPGAGSKDGVKSRSGSDQEKVNSGDYDVVPGPGGAPTPVKKSQSSRRSQGGKSKGSGNPARRPIKRVGPEPVEQKAAVSDTSGKSGGGSKDGVKSRRGSDQEKVNSGDYDVVPGPGGAPKLVEKSQSSQRSQGGGSKGRGGQAARSGEVPSYAGQTGELTHKAPPEELRNQAGVDWSKKKAGEGKNKVRGAASGVAERERRSFERQEESIRRRENSDSRLTRGLAKVDRAELGFERGASRAIGEGVSGAAPLVGMGEDGGPGVKESWRDGPGSLVGLNDDVSAKDAWKETGRGVVAADEWQEGKYGEALGVIVGGGLVPDKGVGKAGKVGRAGKAAGGGAVKGGKHAAGGRRAGGSGKPVGPVEG
ncbi:hypothetical protein ACUY3K_10585, partial [Corynebacterium uberis]